MKEMSDLICGKAAVGGNYNSTRDTVYKIDKVALVNCEIFEKYLETFRIA